MLTLSSGHLKEIIAHCQQGAPNEVCGFLPGREERVFRIRPMTNLEPTPVSYLMDPKEQIEVFNEMDQKGEDLVAIYHSHPHSRPLPSKKDIEMAFYPDSLYLIISLAEGVEVRCFRIIDGRVAEVGIMINPDSTEV